MGLVLSTVVNLWIGIGAVLNKNPPKLKPISIEGCDFRNVNDTFAPFNYTFVSKTINNQDEGFEY